MKTYKFKKDFYMKKTLLIVSIILCVVFLKAEPFNNKTIDCDDGNAKACYDAASDYSVNGYKAKSADSQKVTNIVVKLYKKSCELGYPKGCTAFGMHYAASNEKDVGKDEKYYFQKACDAGDETGCTMLKMMSMIDTNAPKK